MYYNFEGTLCNGNPPLPLEFLIKNARTQKAKGLQTLKSVISGVAPVAALLDVTKDRLELETPSDWSFPIFARPCPMVPRHGFVDSRLVNNWDELWAVVQETKAADPQGEVMLMPFIEASLNMIWTPALLTVGAGHDGATIGKETSTFPLSGKWDDQIKFIAKKAGVDDFPYVEAIRTPKGEIKLTQLRNGPVLDRAKDYIPLSVVVTEVIQPDIAKGDLLGWEELMLGVKGKTGVVVYHPGGSQADHFSIHARSCEVPCVTTFEPQVGQTLEPISTVPPDFKAVLRGLVAAEKLVVETPVEGYQYTTIAVGPYNTAVTMLMCLHHSSVMGGDDAWWVGAGVGLLLRLGSLALRGEARHLLHGHSIRRGAIYTKAIKHRLQRHRMACPHLVNIFRYGWVPNCGGVGGTKWAQCAVALDMLFERTGEFIRKQDKASYGGMLRAYNLVVNQAHNGGWWLNKFTQQAEFTMVQDGSMMSALRTAAVVKELSSLYAGLTQKEIDNRQDLWARTWVPLGQVPPKIVSVKMNSPAGAGWLTLQIKDRLIKAKHVPLTIDIGSVFTLLPEVLDAEFSLRRTKQGLALDVSAGGMKPVEIWKEPPIKAQNTPVELEEEDPPDEDE